MYLFNNCKGRAHARLFGSGAFYDLNITGIQATQATDLHAGDDCIVATPSPDGDIAFTWFQFERDAVLADDTGTPCRVLFGKSIKTDTRSRADAIADPLYSAFFTKTGSFKRQSVLQR